jgi:serine/threonine protein kinase
MTTTVSEQTAAEGMDPILGKEEEALLDEYQLLLLRDCIAWDAQYRMIRLLGKGGQGVVYLSERQGVDLFRLPVALKIFSPEKYRDAASYQEDMARIGDIAGRVAQIQHDSLLDLHNFIAQDQIRIMVMEWVDGFDLRDLLSLRLYEQSRKQLSPQQWLHVNDVILAEGPSQPRLKPGVAIQILRQCLGGLAALHREGIVHGDLKPANIMIKKTGNAKIIDIGSAMDLNKASGRRMWSPTYAAPEVLQGGENSPQADLASLGYILVEMLAGQCPFEGINDLLELFAAKQTLEQRLADLLPEEVSSNELLLNLCKKMIAPNPAQRFSDAQSADLDHKGAADFHRQLVKYDLASEYGNDLQSWLEELTG